MRTHTATVFFILALAWSRSAHGAQGQVQPAILRAGESLDVAYRATNAALDPADGIYAVVSFLTPSEKRTAAVPLDVMKDGSLGASIAVPEDASYAYLSFVTRAQWDEASDLEFMVHNALGQPVRGARLPRVFSEGAGFLELVRQELADYPGNLAAYRSKWFWSTAYRGADTSGPIVRSDLQSIGQADSAEGLWARCYGHLLLGEEAAARSLLIELVQRYPSTMAAANGVRDYSYQCYSQSLTDGSTEVTAVLARVLDKHPGTQLARDQVRRLSYTDDLSLGTIRRICHEWLEREPIHPEPAIILARALLRSGDQLDQAEHYSSVAINGYMRGDARLTGDHGGWDTEALLPMAFLTAAEIARARDDVAKALAYSLASQRMQAGTDAQAHEFEALLWGDLGDDKRAVRSWKRALASGSLRAREALLEFPQESPGIAADNDPEPEYPRAPSFDVPDLEGTAIRLADFHGKVVVLNFWGLGCAPCLKELPQLNGLVQNFAGRPVEFIAFAADSSQSIRTYLDEHEFHYRQTAQAHTAFEDYGVTGLPLHVIIDGAGRIQASLTGAGEMRAATLRVLIEQALQVETEEQ